MKKTISLILVFAMCLCFCACNETTFDGKQKANETTFSGEPKTIVLNDENFRDYFLVYGTVENIEIDEASFGDGDIVKSKAVIKIIPQFGGNWADLCFDIVWEITGTVGDESVRGYTNTASLSLPEELKGGVACELTMSSWVESFPLDVPGGIVTYYLNDDIYVDVDIQSIENVSGTLTVYG